MTDLDPAVSVAICRSAHERLFRTVSAIDDRTARQPSRLPDWTVGHVLTHVARNADGHTHRLAGALRGADVPRYPGGMDERDEAIAAGANRPAAALAADVVESARRLEDVWRRSAEAGWPNAGFLGDDGFTITGSPLRRLREVEVHHVDLGLGYEVADWPDDYLNWELPHVLKRLPGRLSGSDARRLLAWVTGRAELPKDIELAQWM